MTWPDSYIAAPTTLAGGYSTTPASAPTTTPPPSGIFYQSDGLVTIATTATTLPNRGENSDCTAHISGPSQDQGAIIAQGIICEFLVIGIAFLLFFIFYRGRQEARRMDAELVISPGYHAMGRHKHRRDRTGSSKGETDEMTDYLPGLKGYSVPKKHRGHWRSQSVTYDDFERLPRARATPAWENTGVQQPRTAYAQFAPEALTYFQSGHGNVQAVPVMQVPMRTQATQQQRGFEEVMSTTEPSEVSSSSQGKPPEYRQFSTRQQRSRTSSSQR